MLNAMPIHSKIHKLTWLGADYVPPKKEEHIELPDVLMRVHFYRAVREKKSVSWNCFCVIFQT